MSRPLREATTYLVIAFSLAIGIAVAMPHAGINVLLSALLADHGGARSSPSPPRPAASGASCGAAFGLSALGQAHVAVRPARPHAAGRQCLRRRGRAGRRRPASLDLTSSGAGRLDPEPARHAGVHDRPLPGRGDRLARLPAAAGPAAHQPPPGRPRHRLHPRLLPPAADPDRDDVRRVRQPLARGARWWCATITMGGVFYAYLWDRTAQRLAGGDGARCRQHRVRLSAPAPWWPGSEADLAYVAGESGIATFVAVALVGAVLLARAKVWRTGAGAATEVDRSSWSRSPDPAPDDDPAVLSCC